MVSFPSWEMEIPDMTVVDHVIAVCCPDMEKATTLGELPLYVRILSGPVMENSGS